MRRPPARQRSGFTTSELLVCLGLTSLLLVTGFRGLIRQSHEARKNRLQTLQADDIRRALLTISKDLRHSGANPLRDSPETDDTFCPGRTSPAEPCPSERSFPFGLNPTLADSCSLFEVYALNLPLRTNGATEYFVHDADWPNHPNDWVEYRLVPRIADPPAADLVRVDRFSGESKVLFYNLGAVAIEYFVPAEEPSAGSGPYARYTYTIEVDPSSTGCTRTVLDPQEGSTAVDENEIVAAKIRLSFPRSAADSASDRRWVESTFIRKWVRS